MKAASPIDNKEQKLLFLAVSQSEVHIDFDFPRPSFCVPDRGHKSNCVSEKLGA